MEHRKISIKIIDEKVMKLLEDLEALQLIQLVDKQKKNKKAISQQLAGSLTEQQAEQLNDELHQIRNEW